MEVLHDGHCKLWFLDVRLRQRGLYCFAGKHPSFPTFPRIMESRRAIE